MCYCTNVYEAIDICGYILLMQSNGLFTLMKCVSETVSNSDTLQPLPYLPWPPWAARHKIEMIPSLLRRPRWPRQVQ